MSCTFRGRRGVMVLSCLLVLGAGRVGAEDLTAQPDASHWRLAYSPYTHHWRYSTEHKDVWAVAAERQHDNGWLTGGSLFSNSFGQPSGYVYVGRRYAGLLGQDTLYWQWSAGVLYGYTGRYKTKVPLNFGGFSPGALLSAGWQPDAQVSVQFNLLGDAGVMLQLGYEWR